jgi:uncharacterized protein (TIGR00297 family)
LTVNSSTPWQSKLILLLLLPVLAAHLVLEFGHQFVFASAQAWMALGISVGFGLLVLFLRAATPGGALTGALVTATLYLWTPGMRTALWPLAALLLLTLSATRFGRRAKEQIGVAEGKRGRSASQVAANIGFAAVCGVQFSMASVFLHAPVQRIWLVGMVAALAEATADTLSSELGQVLGGEPLLLSTLRRVPRGTDGAITGVGTLCGCLGAAIVVVVALLAPGLNLREAGIALGAAVLGLFVDSILGAWIERRGWLSNDAVNALSTIAAAMIAVKVAARFL